MSQEVYNQDAINGILYFLHSKKIPPIDAHEELIETTGEVVMSVEEIEEFYKKIENREYDLKKKKEVSLKRKREVPMEMVHRVTHVVVERVFVESRPCVRIPDKILYIDKLTYEYGRDYVRITGDDELDVKYELIDGGIIFRNKGDLHLIKAKDEERKMHIIQSDLMAILGTEKLNIEVLKLKEKDEFDFGEEVLKNTFARLPDNFLQTGKLIYEIDQSLLVQIIQKINPAFFISFRLMHHFYLDSFKETVFEMEQWKVLKIVHINDFVFDFKELMENWTHFQVARLKCDCSREDEEPVHDNVIGLLKKLRESPEFRQYQIQLQDIPVTEYNKIMETLKTGIFANTRTDLGGFEYPDSCKTVEMLVTVKDIWFEKEDEVEDNSDEEDLDYMVDEDYVTD